MVVCKKLFYTFVAMGKTIKISDKAYDLAKANKEVTGVPIVKYVELLIEKAEREKK